MPAGGGINAKLGDFYENRLAVWRLLELLDDSHDSVRIRFEEPGMDGFEWWVQRRDGSKKYTQIKRQHSFDQDWTIARLAARSKSDRSILGDIGERLQADAGARCEFFSTLSASHLQNLIASAALSNDLREFEEEVVGGKGMQKSWAHLCSAWRGVSKEQARRFLRRMSVGVIDSESLDAALHAHARMLISGPSSVSVPVLEDFVSRHLCQEITPAQAWQQLKDAELEPTDWYRNGNHLLRIADHTQSVRCALDEERGQTTRIARGCVNALAAKLMDPDGPKVVSVIADAGMGKSAVLAQVLDRIDDQVLNGTAAPVVLMARVDRLGDFHDGAGLGAALGLPGSLAAVVRQAAGGDPALIVLDQVDAFGAGSGRNLGTLDAVAEVVRDAQQLGVPVLLACRAFEADIDERLRRLIGADHGQDTHHVQELGLLEPAEVETALDAAGVARTGLSEQLMQILRTPLHLHMLITLHCRGRLDAAHITTPLHLFEQFYDHVCTEVQHRKPGALIEEVTDKLAVHLSEHQMLTAPAAALHAYRSTLQILISAGWMRRTGGQIGFAHEAFFDYAYAQHHLGEGRSLLELLLSGEQYLFRRTQVRQILTLEREQHRDRYLQEVREVLGCDQVRAHIKELVVALVTRVPDPGIEDWKVLGVLGAVADSPIYEHAHALAAQNPAFGKLLLDTGVVTGYLHDPATAVLGGWLSRLLVKDHPEAVVQLWKPLVGNSNFSALLAQLLAIAPLERSEDLVDLFEAVLEHNRDDQHIETAFRGDFFVTCHGLRGPRARWGIRLVAAWARRRLATAVTSGMFQTQTDGQDGEKLSALAWALTGSWKLLGASMSAREALPVLAADDPGAFAELLLPVVRAAIEAGGNGPVIESGRQDLVFATQAWFSAGHDPDRLLFRNLQQALRTVVGGGDQNAAAAVRDMADSPLASEQALAAAGLAAGHPALADDALRWLESGPHALAQGQSGDHRALSAAVLAAVCTRLPMEQTRTAQYRAATYVSTHEHEHPYLPRQVARQLLAGIPDECLTETARAVRVEGDGETGEAQAPLDPLADGQSFTDITIGDVRSPLSAEAIAASSDTELLATLRALRGVTTRFLDDGRAVGGAGSVADALRQAAASDPDRFVALLAQVPEDLDPAYPRGIVNGLAESTLTYRQALTAVHAAMAHQGYQLHPLGLLLSKAAAGLQAEAVPDRSAAMQELTDLTEQILNTPHPSPVFDSASVQQGLLNGSLPETLANQAMAGPESSVLRVLYVLSGEHAPAGETLNEHLLRLAESPEAVANVLAIDGTRMLIGSDPARALHIAHTALQPREHTDLPEPVARAALLASHPLYALLLRMCWTNYEQITPLLSDMLEAVRQDTAAELVAELIERNAAAVITAAAARHQHALTLLSEPASIARRLGQATVLTQVLSADACTPELAGLLERLFDDGDDEVARAASAGLRHLPGQDADLAARLITAACASRCFTLVPGDTVHATKQFAIRLPETVLEVAERFFTVHGRHAADLSSSTPYEAGILADLILSLCSNAPQGPLALRALDIVDHMVLTRAIGLEGRLAKTDR